MEIYLSKPGSNREGPYTLDQINTDLAARKYNDSDYWAWYEGLEAWVPLYSIPGIVDSPKAAPAAAAEPSPYEQPIPAELESVPASVSEPTGAATAIAEEQ